MRLSLQHHGSSPTTRALALTLVALCGMLADSARGVTAAQLSVVPREDLVDAQIVEIRISDAPPRETLSLDTCAETPAGLTCSERGRSVRVLASGEYGPVAETLRSILVTSAGGIDCRERAASSPCLLVLRSRGQTLASVPLSFRGAALLESEPTLTIAPATSLRDGQTVSVTGRGFDVSVHTGARQCRAGTDQPGDCKPTGRAPITSATGTLRQEVTVYAGFGSLDDDWVDCARPGSCELVVFGGRADGGPTRAPLVFAEGVAVAAPSISIVPADPLQDHDELTVRGEGFAADATLSLEQYVVRGGGQERWHQLIANGFAGTSARGTFTTRLVVRSLTGDDSRVCTDEAPCVLAAREVQGRYGVARVRLRFAR